MVGRGGCPSHPHVEDQNRYEREQAKRRAEDKDVARDPRGGGPASFCLADMIRALVHVARGVLLKFHSFHPATRPRGRVPLAQAGSVAGSKNKAWAIAALTVERWNGLVIRKVGSGRSPVSRRSGKAVMKITGT